MTLLVTNLVIRRKLLWTKHIIIWKMWVTLIMLCLIFVQLNTLYTYTTRINSGLNLDKPPVLEGRGRYTYPIITQHHLPEVIMSQYRLSTSSLQHAIIYMHYITTYIIKLTYSSMDKTFRPQISADQSTWSIRLHYADCTAWQRWTFDQLN
jgi:hypothetical protein